MVITQKLTKIKPWYTSVDSDWNDSSLNRVIWALVWESTMFLTKTTIANFWFTTQNTFLPRSSQIRFPTRDRSLLCRYLARGIETAKLNLRSSDMIRVIGKHRKLKSKGWADVEGKGSLDWCPVSRLTSHVILYSIWRTKKEIGWSLNFPE